jgi:hypothetical protein
MQTSISQQLSQHLKHVYFGGNWTGSNYKSVLENTDWKMATQSIADYNSIALLVYHTSYYVGVQLDVLQGKSLNAKDEYSFLLPDIQSEEDWQELLQSVWKNAEELAQLILQLPDSQLNEYFVDEKYGTWYRNIAGMIEHLHYHLGQIVFMKKMLNTVNSSI